MLNNALPKTIVKLRDEGKGNFAHHILWFDEETLLFELRGHQYLRDSDVKYVINLYFLPTLFILLLFFFNADSSFVYVHSWWHIRQLMCNHLTCLNPCRKIVRMSATQTENPRISFESLPIKPPSHPTYDLWGVIKSALSEDAGDRGLHYFLFYMVLLFFPKHQFQVVLILRSDSSILFFIWNATKSRIYEWAV